MYRDNSVGVVVPAYNEEGFVGGVLRQMPDYVDRIYAVDDRSTDGTWEEIKTVATETEKWIADEKTSIPPTVTDGGAVLSGRATVHEPIGRVVPIRHSENMGAGGAIKTGYLAALQDEMDITVTLDGDGQMDPEAMPKLLDPIVDEDADYAKGNRLLYKEYREEMPRFRFLGNTILTFLTKVASGYWKTMDPQNGYTAISHYALKNVGIEDMYEYYGYCNDLLVKLNVERMRVADIAMPAVYGEEASSIRYRTYIRKVSSMLFRNFFWRLKVKYLVLDFHPLALFYMVGMLTTPLGLIGAVWALNLKFRHNFKLFVPAAASLLVFMLGVMFIMFAMLFDMQVNEDKEVQIRN
jgi:glycosyltransferase involved in cell wall biosynthesis